jgi:cephalosporin hydroxylase
MNEEAFEVHNQATIAEMAADRELVALSQRWFDAASRYQYSYHFRWLGLPIIQLPQDIVALQEIIWRTRPELVIETGIARGGSLVFYASMMRLLGRGHVLGVDIDIREENRRAIDAHPFADGITMLQGSSIDPSVVARVETIAAHYERVMVVLDSLHTHAHVLAELEHYAPLVSPGCYLVVLDTCIEHMPADAFPDRPWSQGDNPMTAVHAFLAQSDRFEIDRTIHDKLQLTVARDGYLRCLR